MKKFLLPFVACAAATAVAGLAFLNNCVVIVRWWRAFLAAGGDTSVMTAEIVGWLPWLDWAAVDHSAVTTFIPALGLLCMTLSLGRLLRGARVRGENFPFFDGSDQLNVALGLFGTLWGIIVIGYFKLDTVTMADLMQCLHTALFSTLMAVVWVFMIDRPLVRPLFRKLLATTDLAETDDGDLVGAVDRLVARLGEASDAFDRRQVAFEKAFRDRQGEFEKTFRDRQAAFETAVNRREADAERRRKAADEAFQRRLTEMDAFCQGRLAAYEREFELRQKEYVEVFRRRIDELQSVAGEAKARAESADARLAAVARALNG